MSASKSFQCLCLMAVAVQAANYNYDKSGADWGNTASLCETGKKQSPIDLPALGSDQSSVSDELKVQGQGYVNYTDASLQYLQHTLKVDTGAGNYYYTDENGTTYPFTFAQFHMHAPSEHSVDGKLYDLEMHFVHVADPNLFASSDSTAKDQEGVADYAVVGVFFDRVAGGN